MDLKKLKELRKQRNLKLVDMAKSTGLTRALLAKIENGDGNPAFKNVVAYIECLGDVDLLLCLRI